MEQQITAESKEDFFLGPPWKSEEPLLEEELYDTQNCTTFSVEPHDTTADTVPKIIKENLIPQYQKFTRHTGDEDFDLKNPNPTRNPDEELEESNSQHIHYSFFEEDQLPAVVRATSESEELNTVENPSPTEMENRKTKDNITVPTLHTAPDSHEPEPQSNVGEGQREKSSSDRWSYLAHCRAA